MKQLFAKKSLNVLLDEMSGEHRLHRVLGPVSLSALGIGAIIGTGIFVLVGKAAHDTTGPALMLSFVVAGFHRQVHGAVLPPPTIFASFRSLERSVSLPRFAAAVLISNLMC